MNEVRYLVKHGTGGTVSEKFLAWGKDKEGTWEQQINGTTDQRNKQHNEPKRV